MTSVIMTGLTDPGRLRDANEDSIALRPDLGLAVLADGMGGHQAGEVASSMAVDLVLNHVQEVLTRSAATTGVSPDAAQAIGDAIKFANGAIYDAAHSRPDYHGMGSTIVVAVFDGGHMWVGHVGDSRLYRFRAGRLEQLTQDHSVVQELVNRGLFTLEEARQTVAKNLVTRALGVDPEIAPDIGQETFQSDDIYLLCSDGLNEVVPDNEIATMLSDAEPVLDAVARRLVDLANERGGPDNISVILARIGKPAR